MSIRKSLTLKEKGGGAARELITAALRGIGFSPLESGEQKEVQYYAEKGNFTRLGVYVTHLSILIILLGAIVGVKFGFNGSLALPEGETSSFAYKAGESYRLGECVVGIDVCEAEVGA